MTEPTLLDENAISKIEARIAKRDDTSALESACGEYNCSCHYDLPALCATVKHLRAENNEYERRWRNQTQRNHTLSQSNRDLQSQLEQLRAENERLQGQYDGAVSDFAAEINSVRDRLAQVEQERDAATERADCLQRQLLTEIEKFYRAIQLCKDKAADLNREVNKVDPDDDPTYFQVLAARIATADELATELEKL